MAKRNVEDIPPHDRRGFFAAGLSRLLRPLADAIEQRLPAELPVVRSRLRPPGAIIERDFLETCYRCGSCADACPVDAIALLQGEDEQQDGTPYINADLQACTLCDDLACMNACPSGALEVVDRFAVRVGRARVDYGLCVRSKGEACTECLDRCPLGETAIRLYDNGRVHVIDPTQTGKGCTGCGVCQQHCPTKPVKAIRVYP
ncbi:MAG: 4Fe-4S dicluster domain-containing protein [Phycisphaerae bacterium]|nr:4Fe-4S dicluster domain-containing protein [Phycisphaerae bacterium]